ncbi:hypothetical protein D9757_004666 [Collybiopsis confluens]|uniref:SHSP domain-containing protein n=1 Tax=Collybiopsis confluens TaxID=2823264 RepID=A0A8H5MC62_9AGAR|nr:hypothetical protein D9757_004666 [Collybiopsis confluens]
MSYYHHGGPFQHDTNNLSSTPTPTEHPSWETIDPAQQQHQDSPSDSHNSAFVSPITPVPHALSNQQLDFDLHTPEEYALENPDPHFQHVPSASMLMNFPQERLVHSEGHPSPETDFYHPSPSPTTPTTMSLPRMTRSRVTTTGSGGRTSSRTKPAHHPYPRPQSALAGSTGARYNVMTSTGGMPAYPASMSAPESGTSFDSSSTMLPPARTQVVNIPTAATPATSPSTSNHPSMGPPPQPSQQPGQQSSQSQLPHLTRLRSHMVPPTSAAPSASFEYGVRQIRAISKHFFTPRLDCFYNRATNILMAYFELPGVRRENIHISLANSAIPRQRHVNIWGFSLSPNWVFASASGTGGTSSMTGTTTLTSSGSLSSSSSRYPSTPSTSAAPQSTEAAAGATHTSPASWGGGSAGGADSSRPLLTPAMSASLGYDIPPQYSSRERKYGEFFRLLPVPPETRAHDVRAKLEEGVLILSIECGEPYTEGQVNASRELVSID